MHEPSRALGTWKIETYWTKSLAILNRRCGTSETRRTRREIKARLPKKRRCWGKLDREILVHCRKKSAGVGPGLPCNK